MKDGERKEGNRSRKKVEELKSRIRAKRRRETGTWDTGSESKGKLGKDRKKSEYK